MRIALDAMGTDRAPGPEVAGAIEALREFEPDVEVVGARVDHEAQLERAVDPPGVAVFGRIEDRQVLDSELVDQRYAAWLTAVQRVRTSA